MPMVAPWRDGDGCLRFQIAGQVLPLLRVASGYAGRPITASTRTVLIAAGRHDYDRGRTVLTFASGACTVGIAAGLRPAMSSLESTRRCANPALCSDRVGA